MPNEMIILNIFIKGIATIWLHDALFDLEIE